MNFRCLFALLFISDLARAQADDKWWFDVEVILFDRAVALTELDEQFPFADNLRPVDADLDLITNLLQPDITHLKQSLPECGKDHVLQLTSPPSVESILREHEKWKVRQDGKNNRINDVSNSLQNELPADVASDAAYAIEPAARPAQPNADSNIQASGVADPVTAQRIAQLWMDNALPPLPPRPSVPRMQFCREITPWLTWEHGKWTWHREDNSIPYPDEIKIELNGDDNPAANYPRILPDSARELTKLSQQIRQARGLNRLLHMTWRQQVKFGQDKADKVRLFAGNDYSNQFTLTGDEKSDEVIELTLAKEGVADATQDEFFNDLYRQLAEPQEVPFASMMAAIKDDERKAKQGSTTETNFARIPIWKLDGYMKVYLKYINRVPYLHIESELFYRQPIPLTAKQNDQEDLQYRLVSIPFQQMRRVISKQIHYFDHPLFGMVVQIRRHQLPMDEN
ncbi:peptidoglycan binding protein CsiV [Alteromonas ponticola]|uniref:Peptidoglycan binding protein CsiV n=1 Tax=Alteromonas aquimaris TaxID=2998417 RepID=A0ABT3P7M7_9ALTE|nr:CsiV family protein [Alteromonas aquimaris]MCW8108771.1 peptidoglycan binding protein CsiV [Alteromonas aquimaris]